LHAFQINYGNASKKTKKGVAISWAFLRQKKKWFIIHNIYKIKIKRELV